MRKSIVHRGPAPWGRAGSVQALASYTLAIIIAALAVSGQSHADALPGETPIFNRYAACVRDIGIDAERAYDTASRWRAEAGSDNRAGAMHCEALALSALGVYPSAAKALIRIAALPEFDDPKRKVDILIQAGHAFMLAGDASKALEVFGQGLAFVSFDTLPLKAGDLHMGRARALALKEDWSAALDALNTVLVAMPQHDEALLVRASVHRAMHNPAAATLDLANYLTLWPNDPAGLLERGYLRLAVQDYAGAQKDFERTVSLAKESALAARASGELAKLEFRRENREEEFQPGGQRD